MIVGSFNLKDHRRRLRDLVPQRPGRLFETCLFIYSALFVRP